jgi:hypothetical protein
MSSALEKALRLVAKNGAEITGEWWIIGSTAARLSGFDQFEPDDVDVFGNTETMNAFVKSFGCELSKAPDHHQFRSVPYQRITLPETTPIEVMGGLEVCKQQKWQKLSITTRIEISGFGAPLWIPPLEEQIAIFELFGRPKDLAKAVILNNALCG